MGDATLPLLAALAFLSALASWWLTGRMRAYAIQAQLMDVPNARSSHASPTPRGGGLAIVAVFLAGVLVLFFAGFIPLRDMLAFVGGGGSVALIGFVDDKGHVPARWRLLAHFVAVALAVAMLEPWHVFVPTAGPVFVVIFGTLLGLAAVWLLNLYNFMDGIDGIAGGEAVSLGVMGAVLLWLSGAPGLAAVSAVLAAAAAGFLIWNFPPAKIFMGDVGSGFLGFCFACLVLASLRLGPNVFVAWCILAGAFVVDASVTLLRRLLRGERVWEAHRSHAYQRLSRAWHAHRPVTLSYIAVNLLWLSPIALMTGAGVLSIGVGLAAAYLPLTVVAWRLGAGLPDEIPLFGGASKAR